jgi:hypothetical protein
MNTTESLALLQETINEYDVLIRQVNEVSETLGNAEDIMVDDAAMTLLNMSIESINAQIRRSQEKLQQAIEVASTTRMDTTDYLTRYLASDAEASRQARSLINERGYEAQAAERLHEWVESHISAILSPPVLSNPYKANWPTWMKDILTEALQQVDWNELVNSLKETETC